MKSSNKQVPDSSGSTCNEKRFLKGRSPAFFRRKILRARYRKKSLTQRRKTLTDH